MAYEWCDMPMITCPHCEKEFQLDDYYDYSIGDTFDCYKCEKEIHIQQIEMIMSVRIGTSKDA